jgi:hypothetical protein
MTFAGFFRSRNRRMPSLSRYLTFAQLQVGTKNNNLLILKF